MATPEESLPIRIVASLTGVNPVTLRTWERRHGLVKPLRTPKGHRLFTRQDVERIRRVLALLDRGVPIGKVRAFVDAERADRTDSRAEGRWREYVELMAGAIARFDESELDRLYDQALSLHPVETVTRQLVLPLLSYLGERWVSVGGGIAEEHFFAVYLRSKLGARLQHRMRYASGPRIVAACAPGERHEIGLLLFALEAHEAGLRTVLLGADTPFAQVLEVVRRSGARGVVISSSVEPAPHLLGCDLRELAREAAVPVFVGGATAVRRRAGIVAAGAVPVGIDIEHGARLVAALIASTREAA